MEITPSVRDAVLRIMNRDGITPYRVSKDSGVPLTTVYNFYRGDCLSMKLTNAEKIMKALGIVIAVTPSRPSTAAAQEAA